MGGWDGGGGSGTLITPGRHKQGAGVPCRRVFEGLECAAHGEGDQGASDCRSRPRDPPRRPQPQPARDRPHPHLVQRLVLRDRARRLRLRGARDRRRRPRRADPLPARRGGGAAGRGHDRPLLAPRRARGERGGDGRRPRRRRGRRRARRPRRGRLRLPRPLRDRLAAPYGPAESSLSPILARTPQQLSAGNVNHAAMENGGQPARRGRHRLPARRDLARPSSSASPPGPPRSPPSSSSASSTTAAPPTSARATRWRAPRARSAPGLRTLGHHPGLRLAWLTTALLLVFEGFAEVIVVGLALHQLHLAEGSVGFLNAAWGVGAIVGGGGLALLLDRGRLVIAIAGGSIVLGAATMLPGLWAVPVQRLPRLVRDRHRLRLRRGRGEDADAAARRRRDDGPPPHPAGVGAAGGDGGRLAGRDRPRRSARHARRLDRRGRRDAGLRRPLLDAAARLRGRARRSPRSPTGCCARTRSSQPLLGGDGRAPQPRPQPDRVRGRASR